MRIFYTAPALSEEPETSEKVRNLKIHIDDAGITKWIWVLDFSKMKVEHTSSLDFIRSIVDIIEKDHMNTLQNIVVLNATVWVRWAATAAKAFVRNELFRRVMFADNILCDFQKLYLPPPVIHAVLWKHHQLSSS